MVEAGEREGTFAIDKVLTWRRFLIVCGGLYVLFILAMIVAGGFIPYVLDNNETYSNIVHARSIFEFGLRGAGLADDGVGVLPESGPVYYTHGGNFPRIFAFIIYALGARNAESQIIVTTLTIGLGGFLYGLHVIRRICPLPVAMAAGILLLTDYLMVVQWQVVTWQVWRLPFLFSSLHLTILIVERWTFRRFILAFINFACLFFFDIAYAVFVVTVSGLFAFSQRPSLRGALKIATISSGCLFGAAVLITQNVIALGWDVFLADLRFTYMGRNILASPQFLKEAMDFYAHQPIATFFNFGDATMYRRPFEMLRSFCTNVLNIYTPPLSYMAILLGCAPLVAAIRGKPSDSRHLPTLFIMAAFLCMVAVALSDFTRAPQSLLLSGVVAFLAFCDLQGHVAVVTASDDRPSPGRWLAATGLLLAVALLSLFQTRLFAGGQQPPGIHAQIVPYLGGRAGQAVILVGSAWLAAHFCLENRKREVSAIRPVGLLLLCGICGYVLVTIFSPGYVVRIILSRLSPLTVGIHILLFALMFASLATNIPTNLRNARLGWQLRSVPMIARGLVPPALFLVLTGLWSGVQITYALTLRPDAFPMLRILERDFKGKTFVSNMYAAPVAISTGNWAYYDPDFSEQRVDLTEDGFQIHQDLSYLWFADRNSNPDYRHPQYFICMQLRNISYATPAPKGEVCGNKPLIRQARTDGNAFLGAEEIVRDESGEDRWSILRLDWTPLPYPRPLNDRGELLRANVTRNADQTIRVKPVLNLARTGPQPDRIVFLLREQKGCIPSITAPSVQETTDPEKIILKPGSGGIFTLEARLISHVAPLTVRLFSAPFVLTGGRIAAATCQETLPEPRFAFMKEPKHD